MVGIAYLIIALSLMLFNPVDWHWGFRLALGIWVFGLTIRMIVIEP